MYSRPSIWSEQIAELSDYQKVEVVSDRIGTVENGFREVRPTSNTILLSYGYKWFSNSSSTSGWVVDRRLLDNCDTSPGRFGCLPVTRFGNVLGGGYVRRSFGFGPSSFAQKNCKPGKFGTSDCPYNRLRGLHNGLDFPSTQYDYLIWIGSGNGSVKQFDSHDGDPNTVIRYGNYDVVYAHVDANHRYVSVGDTVRPGQLIGRGGPDHLHIGVRQGYRFYNPLFWFSGSLQGQITSLMYGYPEGYNAYSMYWFDTTNIHNNFWNPCPDNSHLWDIMWYISGRGHL